jgi:osmoprotectant transport system substrate-binding protein
MKRGWRTTAAIAALALGLAACGGGDGTSTDSSEPASEPGATVPDGPTIVVGSFNFGESQILGNIYAIALQEAGYPVETKLDLGTREVILPELENGNLSFLPEYAGSALSVGFGGGATGDLDETIDLLRDEFADIGVTVLEPAPGQNTNAFAVTADFAQEHGLTTIADLANVDGMVRFAGPPECEDRATCHLALTDTYGLDNIAFEAIQEGGVRVSALTNGDVEMALLFTTQPVIDQEGFVVLEDTEGAIPVENIVPVVTDAVIDAYGDDFVSLIDSISELITTDLLIELNGKVEIDAEDADDVARQWLTDEGII